VLHEGAFADESAISVSDTIVRETPMPPEQQKSSDISAEQRASSALVRLIRKLRWMGMQEEAESAQKQLAQCRVPPADSVVAAPHDTD
jgi:hypothetical protein